MNSINVITKDQIRLLEIDEIVKIIYTPEKYESKEEKDLNKRNYKNIERLISYIKNNRFESFIEKLRKNSINFKNTDISTHKIDLDDIIYPERYLSKGVNGVTFLSKLSKLKNKNLPGDDEKLIVKYEIIDNYSYNDCKNKYINCIDRFKNDVNKCKVEELYCRLTKAFIEIYINKVFIRKLKSRNFAMFYAFFMCPTNKISFDNNKEPKKEFINKYINNGKFCSYTGDKFTDDDNVHVFSVYEYIPGTTLADYIIDNSFNIYTFFKILLQIFATLASVQKPEEICYNHNDLHSYNVMVEKYPPNVFYPYVYFFPYEKTKNTFYSNVRAVIIDQGNSSLLTKSKKDKIYDAVFGWYKTKLTNTIKNYNSPYVDVYKIITHSCIVMKYYKKDKKDIQTLNNIINKLFSLDDTVCTDFLQKQYSSGHIGFDYYILYLQKNYNNHEKLIKKIEEINYESAYNFIVKYFK
jgi:serine/threonine protein kinase